jgi:sugar (pentulose or hexulose) kinase
MPVAMVHCNNCTADINAWMKTYLEFCGLVGVEMDEDTLYAMFLQKSMCGDMDCGGITVIGYLAGEHVTDFATGCPLVLRGSASRFTLANFLRAQMNSAFASLAVGMRILRRENVSISRITAHGSFFKTPELSHQYLADAVNAPVAVMENTAESGAYGMALLTAFRLKRDAGETLEHYLDNRVFADARRALAHRLDLLT